MVDETGFFRFDTNANAVASEIQTAMGRIQGAITSGSSNFDQGSITRDTAAMGQAFRRLETDLSASQRRVQSLMQQYVDPGGISGPEFRKRFQAEVRQSIGSIPSALASELAMTPRTTANRVDAAAIGRQVANDYVRTLTETVAAGGPEFQRGFQRLMGKGGFDTGTFAADVGRVSQSPVAFGQETTRMQQLINRVRAEEFLKQNNTGSTAPAYMQDYVEQVRQQSQFNDAGNLIPSSAAAELNELVREQREAEQTARRLGREYERTAQQARELAAAERQLTASTQMFAGRLLGPDGKTWLKPTATGVTDEANPVRAQQASDAKAKYDTEVGNAARLMQNFDQVSFANGYAVMGQEVYRLNAHGAERIRNEVTIQRVLEQQAATMARQEGQQAGLAQRQVVGQSGVLGGFLNRFQRGDQSFGTGMGGQIASAASFSLAYGSIFGAIGAGRDTLEEMKQYRESLTDMRIATAQFSEDQSGADQVTRGFVNNLGELARVSGANVGAALDTAAKGVRAFGQEIQTITDAEQVGEATNRAATQLALISDKSLTDATGDLVASGTAFGLGPDQLGQITDAVTNAAYNVGGDASQISQGLATIAGSAMEAGYTLDEAAAVMGLVQSRTDQSGQAISTRLSRIFQIISGNTGKALAREFNIDPNQSIKDQIEAYAEIYSDPNTSEASRDRITSALGGTANLRELLPLLKENTVLQKAYEKAITDTGQGTDKFVTKSQDLTGTLRRVGGTIRQIQTNLGDSGLFAPLGAGLQVVDNALEATLRLLQLYNELPGPLRQTLGILVNIAAISKAISVVQGRSALISGAATLATGVPIGGTSSARAVATESAASAAAARAATGTRVAAERGMSGAIVGASRERLAAERAGTAAAAGGVWGGARGRMGRLAGRGGTLGGLGSLLLGLTGPVGLAVGGVAAGLYGYNKISQGFDQRAEFTKQYAGAQGGLSRIDGTSSSLEAAVKDLRSAAGEIEKGRSSFISRGRQDELRKGLEAQADVIQRMSERVAAEEARTAARASKSVFGAGEITNVDQLATGIENLTAQGQNAITVVRMLGQALDEEFDPETSRRFKPEEFTSTLANQVNPALQTALEEIYEKRDVTIQEALNPTDQSRLAGPSERLSYEPIGAIKQISKSDAAARFGLTAEDTERVQGELLRRATEMGLREDGKFNDAQIDELIALAVQAADLEDLGDGKAKVVREFTKQLRSQLMGIVGPEAFDPARILNGPTLDRNQILGLLNPSEDGSWQGFGAYQQEALNAIPKSDDGTMRLQVLRNNLRDLRRMDDKRVGPEIQQLTDAINSAESDYVEARLERSNTLRRAAQSRPGISSREVARIGARSLRRDLRTAGTDVSKIVTIMEMADQAALDEIETGLREAAEAERAARMQRARARRELSFVVGGMGARPDVDAFAGEPTPAENIFRAFRRGRRIGNVPEKDGTYRTGSDAAGYAARQEREKEDEKESRADLAAARAAAQAARAGGGSMAQARAALTSARAQLADAKKGTVEYYQALATFYDAQRGLQDAIVAQSSARASANAARLGGSIAPAQAALVAARAQLRVSVKGTTEYFQALGSFYDAQRQMRDAMNEYRSTTLQLSGDITDPVENARDELRAARARMASNRGAGRDVRAQDRLATRQAETQLEAEKFNQRLGDVQTAEQLGKISHARYIQYLENESRRLNRVKNRTRQQQDQLNQIDLALKDAKSAGEGMFNLGDINTSGLVYQVRRQQAEARAARASSRLATAQSTMQQTVTISVNGADTAKVQQIISRYLNVPTSQNQGLVRRKV